ncbi:hypothetical protein ACQKGD_19675 [Peribacillus frigoritolerans]|uniref:hypothetical protein n=1 Tax=Peribacillus frigoritolerans TaxID=450367 RepID=UPI003CFD6C72
MKKFIMITFATMIMFSSGVIVNAKEENAKRVEGGYFSTEDILFSIIEPKLEKIVNDQYGKEMIVNPMKVNDVYFMEKRKSTKGKDTIDGWIELDMIIMVGDRKPNENFKVDAVVLKIDAPNIGGTAPHLVSDKIEGIQVDLVKYYKHK